MHQTLQQEILDSLNSGAKLGVAIMQFCSCIPALLYHLRTALAADDGRQLGTFETGRGKHFIPEQINDICQLYFRTETMQIIDSKI